MIDAPRKLSFYHTVDRDRVLADFADDIITRACGETNAVLDCGYFVDVSDPDFAPSGWGKTSEEAAANCARAIRANADGTTRRSPSGCFEHYSLRYRLMPHWGRKETMKDLGIDLRAAHERAYAAFGDWEFEAQWLNRLAQARHYEFFFILLQEDRRRLVDAGVLSTERAIENILSELSDEGEGTATRGKINDAIRTRVRERLEEFFAA